MCSSFPRYFYLHQISGQFLLKSNHTLEDFTHDESFWPSPLCSPPAGPQPLAEDDDDDKVPEADMAKVTAALADLGCKDPEDRRCQVQDGQHGHQPRQGLLRNSYFALLDTPLVAT